MKEESRRKLSASLKKKWASGTRKPNPEGYGKKIGATNKRKMAEGTMRKREMSSEQGRAYFEMRDHDEIIKTNRRLGLERMGQEMKSPICKKGEAHHRAKYWCIQNKGLGVTLEGLNLTQLIRDNEHLFDVRDLNWDRIGITCRAKKGLSNLYYIRKSTGRPHALSWKGWVAK